MSAFEVLASIEAAGATLALNDGDIHLEVGAEELPADLVEQLRAHKLGLVQILVAREAPAPCGRQPRALDLYCGAGGVARGLMQAGFHVTGVDVIPQPRYCGDVFAQADALEYLKAVDVSQFDFIWASPPCQRYTSLRHAPGEHRNADLIAPTREALIAIGKPYVIENVPGAPLIHPITLSGSMFGFGAEGWRIERSRLFEASFPLIAPARRKDDRPVVGVYGGHFRDRRRGKGENHRSDSNVPSELGYQAMGIPFGSMTTAEISDAIPPAYSRYIAEQWFKQTGAEYFSSPPPPKTAEHFEQKKPEPGSRGSRPKRPKKPEPETSAAPEPVPASVVEPPVVRQIDDVEVVYCSDRAEAEALIREMIADAASKPVALDIETTPILSERQRFAALSERLGAVHVELLAAGKALRAAQKAEAKGEPHDDVAALGDALKAVARQEKHLAAQAEHAASAGLDPHRSHIRALQLYGGKTRAAVIDVFRVGQSILAMLEGAAAVAHNAVFELLHLGHVGIELGAVHDTQQAAKLALGLRQSSLAEVVKHYRGVKLEEETRASDWGAAILSEAQICYAARDVIWLWSICPPLFRDVAQQISVYKVQLAALPAIARMNRAGITLDLAGHAAAMQAFAEQDAAACEAYRAACIAMEHPELAEKTPRSDAEVAGFLKAVLSEGELKRWKQISKPWELSTARSELRRAIHYAPIVPLIELSELDAPRLCFGETLRFHVSPVTGRLHPSYQVCGAPSGRSSCSKPNVQGAPRNGKIRALFKAADGCVFFAADYSGMELRAAAAFFEDAALSAVFERGEDPHRITAARVTGKPLEEISDEERTHAKSTNFGTIYGISPAGLIEQIWKNSHLVVSLDEAERLLDAFGALYPDLMAHRNEYVLACQARREIVIGPEWRERRGRIVPFARLPEDQSERTCCLSYPIQGLCADVCMKAIADVDRRLREENIDARLVGWIHDELIVEGRERDGEQIKALLKDAMEQAFLAFFPNATLNKLVEVNVGANWAAVKEKQADGHMKPPPSASNRFPPPPRRDDDYGGDHGRNDRQARR
jgi:DNA polymerase I-like protein with 3'-5' exonuclease and polymerase domains